MNDLVQYPVRDGMVLLFLYCLCNVALCLYCVRMQLGWLRRSNADQPFIIFRLDLFKALAIAQLFTAGICALSLAVPEYMAGVARATLALFVGAQSWVTALAVLRIRTLRMA